MTATDYSERRQHVRVYFDGLDELQCQFVQATAAAEPHAAAVHDLSLGGLHLSLGQDGGFAVGGRLSLQRLAYRNGQVCEARVPMEIRWIFARPGFSRLYMGCQFLDLPDTVRAWITALVAAKERAAAAGRPKGPVGR
ncbi:MAG: PilZ domain-containing protein [Desulfobulbus sp.]|nr:PilZ domain-containing protein [Desulfobulbus sp.]